MRAGISLDIAKALIWTSSFLTGRSIQVPVNAGFLLYINDMLDTSNIHCYADDSTGDAGLAREIDQCWEKLVSSIEFSLEKVAEWGKFNPQKTQVCTFTTKKNPISSPSIGSILGLEIPCNCKFRGHELAPKKLGVIDRAWQYFKTANILALCNVRPYIEYCCHLWCGAPQYQLYPLDRVQRREARIVWDLVLCERSDHLAMRRDIASLCDIIPTIWMCGGPPQCGFQGAFFHVLRSCGMNFLVRCFRDEMTIVPSKKARTPSLKAGNTPVIPLVLQEKVGGGDHLTPGNPYARLPSFSIKKIDES
ncbi:unnamed protein product [Leptidea sinapis]|uniref:Reverse transcriptase domain-containing protein n=1 Tax=Leptidea sinapis TaxID=189913 RepID=A0A5E4QW61_9NEOP|nr:unnamed protein product [Leptidea sinapis]